MLFLNKEQKKFNNNKASLNLAKQKLSENQNKLNLVKQKLNKNKNSNIITFIHNRNTEFFTMKYEDGNTILHISILEEYPNEIINAIIDKYPDIVKIRNNLNYLPIELALKQKLSIETLDLLIKNNKNETNIKDYIKYAILEKSNFIIIKHFIDMYPGNKQSLRNELIRIASNSCKLDNITKIFEKIEHGNTNGEYLTNCIDKRVYNRY